MKLIRWSRAEVAEALGVSTRTTYRWIISGLLSKPRGDRYHRYWLDEDLK